MNDRFNEELRVCAEESLAEILQRMSEHEKEMCNTADLSIKNIHTSNVCRGFCKYFAEKALLVKGVSSVEEVKCKRRESSYYDHNFMFVNKKLIIDGTYLNFSPFKYFPENLPRVLIGRAGSSKVRQVVQEAQIDQRIDFWFPENPDFKKFLNA